MDQLLQKMELLIAGSAEGVASTQDDTLGVTSHETTLYMKGWRLVFMNLASMLTQNSVCGKVLLHIHQSFDITDSFRTPRYCLTYRISSDSCSSCYGM